MARLFRIFSLLFIAGTLYAQRPGPGFAFMQSGIPSYPLRDSLLFFLALDEPSGTRADSTGRGYSFTDNNSVYGVPSTLLGSGLMARLNGVDSLEYLSREQTSWNLGDSSWTLHMWVWRIASTQYGIYFGNFNSAFNRTNYIGENDRNGFVIANTAWHCFVTSTSGWSNQSIGSWHLLLGVFDHTKDTAFFYVNDTLKGKMYGPNLCLVAGLWKVNDPGYGNIYAENAAIWRRALTQSERTWLYNNRQGRF